MESLEEVVLLVEDNLVPSGVFEVIKENCEEGLSVSKNEIQAKLQTLSHLTQEILIQVQFDTGAIPAVLLGGGGVLGGSAMLICTRRYSAHFTTHFKL